MEQCSLFNWVLRNEGEEMMNSLLRQCLSQSKMELEATIVAAQEEIIKKEEELNQLKKTLNLTLNQKDQALSKLQTLILQNQNQHLQNPAPLSSENEKEISTTIISYPSYGGVASSPPLLTVGRCPLPEKGRLLEAVMDAGPLLQTLLLAAPLPQWQNPPPQLDSIEIPIVRINVSDYSSRSRKRGADCLGGCIISSPKHHRVV